MIKKLGEVRDGLTGRYRSKIRERAITQAKARIVLSEKDRGLKLFNDYDLNPDFS